MGVFYLERLNQFGKNHADARRSLATWKDIVENAKWQNKQNVLNNFPHAKMVKNNKARFEMRHNTYRLIAQLFYDEDYLEIRFIGRNEYDKIDAETI